MPIFEFMCDKCGDEQSHLVSYEDSQKIDHEKCVNEGCDGYLCKKISLSGFQLRGSGWTGRGR